MKLTEAYFFPVVTNAGVEELYCFAKSVLYKYYRHIPQQQQEDVLQEIVLRCLEHLPKYDKGRKVPLGGYMFLQARGACSCWVNHNYRELAFPSDIVMSIHNYRKKKNIACF